MVQVLVHLEASEDPARAGVWWADSSDVPGFAAAADSLEELRIRVTDALRDIEREQGRDPYLLEVSLHLADTSQPTGADPVDVRFAGGLQAQVTGDRAPGPAAATVLQPALQRR